MSVVLENILRLLPCLLLTAAHEIQLQLSNNSAGAWLNMEQCLSKERPFEDIKVPMKWKNNCWLFERLFKIQANGAFLFEISFFVPKILTLLYYGNYEESDDVINCATKMVKYWIKSISRNITEAVFFKLGGRNAHHQFLQLTSCYATICGIYLSAGRVSRGLLGGIG